MLMYIPTWVFAVLALLLGLGLLQSRTRWVAPSVVRAVAIGLAAYSLWGVIGAFGADAAMASCWAAGVAAAVLLGGRLLVPRGMSFNAVARRVLVPGSWAPLVIMLGIFGIKFGVGFAAGVGTPVQAGSATAAAIALSLGLFSGAFLARARAIAAVAENSPNPR